jgi:hypothetical protein
MHVAREKVEVCRPVGVPRERWSRDVEVQVASPHEVVSEAHDAPEHILSEPRGARIPAQDAEGEIGGVGTCLSRHEPSRAEDGRGDLRQVRDQRAPAVGPSANTRSAIAGRGQSAFSLARRGSARRRVPSRRITPSQEIAVVLAMYGSYRRSPLRLQLACLLGQKLLYK